MSQVQRFARTVQLRLLLRTATGCNGSMTASPLPAEWPHSSGVQPVVLRVVCLRQLHGILAPKDIKAAFRYEVRHAKVRGPG